MCTDPTRTKQRRNRGCYLKNWELPGLYMSPDLVLMRKSRSLGGGIQGMYTEF